MMMLLTKMMIMIMNDEQQSGGHDKVKKGLYGSTGLRVHGSTV